MPTTSHDHGLTGFDHVDLYVRDRPKAADFFAKQLGFVILGEGPNHTFLLVGDQVLGLHDPPKGNRNDGVDHLAFRVSEWTGLRNRLKRARVTVLGEKERAESRSIYVKGPSRLKIELVFRPDPEQHPRHPPLSRPVEPVDPEA
jgi:catechol-2,3-dioxygenase